MMISYFWSFFKANTIKVTILLFSLALYFGFVVSAITLNDSVEKIAEIPLKQIGVETIVQKTGKIPGQMLEAIFPHSNAPIYTEEVEQIGALPFVGEVDTGIYFWYFDKIFFKTLLGMNPDAAIISGILQSNLLEGSFAVQGQDVLVTDSFAGKHSLGLDDRVEVGTVILTIKGILKPNLSGNIIPADIYLHEDTARLIARNSTEMNRIYELNDDFHNVVLLKVDPSWSGDTSEPIQAIGKDLLVFSENTFSATILEQLQLISNSGKVMFGLIGFILSLAFAIMINFNLKTREGDIAILRMLGWKIADLKKQFIGESLIILLGALVAGNLLAFGGLEFLARQTISMELPWDISAKPHFMPQENNIERVIESAIPIHYDPIVVLVVSAGFLALFFAICTVIFARIKKISPAMFAK